MVPPLEDSTSVTLEQLRRGFPTKHELKHVQQKRLVNRVRPYLDRGAFVVHGTGGYKIVEAESLCASGSCHIRDDSRLVEPCIEHDVQVTIN